MASAAPVTKASSPKFDFGVVGSSGLVQQDGRIDVELNVRLRGTRGPLMYREMSDNDSVLGAIIYIVKTFIKQAPWTTTPADENDPEALDWAEFVQSCIDDMSHTWSDLMSEILSMVVYGWSYFEVCYKRRDGMQPPGKASSSKHDDGYIGWRKISIRPQNTLSKWEFDDEGGIKGMWQVPPPSSAGNWLANNQAVLIDINRSLLFRTETTSNNPEGRSMLRNAVRAYLYAKRMQETEAVGTERDLSGYPIMECPLSLFSATDASNGAMLNQLQQTLSDIRRDQREGAIIPCEIDSDGSPTGFKFRLMSGGGSRALNLDQIIRRYESRMAMGLLGEFILLGTDKVGSKSMHSSKEDVFTVSLMSLVKTVADVMNRYAVTRLCTINGCPPEKIPTLVPGDIAAPPLDEIVKFVQGMASAGMIQYSQATERWVRAQAGMPEPEEDALPGEGDASGMDEQSQQVESEETDAVEAA